MNSLNNSSIIDKIKKKKKKNASYRTYTKTRMFYQLFTAILIDANYADGSGVQNLGQGRGSHSRVHFRNLNSINSIKILSL